MSGLVDELGIVIVLSPVVPMPSIQSLRSWPTQSAARMEPSDRIVRLSPSKRGQVIPRSDPLTTSGRTVCPKTSPARGEEC
jgi:hypothetical protein